MNKFAAACALACALILGVAGTAGAKPGAATVAGPITWGVADDTGKYADDGGKWFNTQLKAGGMTEVRWTLSWSPTRPTTIDELPFLERAAPQAQQDGIKVELAMYGRPAAAHDPVAFCNWAELVATTVAKWGIHDYIVWNEPNTALYWSPQTDSTPADYVELLALCYDKLHGADPLANVIGFGLSPRKGTATQTAPIPFLKAAGEAYKKSGRTKPIMDQLSVHPYPNPNNPTDGPDVGYANEDFYGIPNLDRIKKAVWEAWNGSGQPTTLNGLLLVIDEVGWQTDTTKYTQYVNNENVSTVSEAQQVQYHQRTIQQYFACDADIATVNWFLLVDEPYRDGRDAKGNVLGGGWQSGLMTAGGEGVSTAKPAYAALTPLHNQGRSACTGKEVDWKPASAGGGSGGGGSNGGAGSGGSLDLDGVTTLFDEDTAANVADAFAEIQTAFFTGTSSWTDLKTTIDSVVASFQAALGQFRQRGHVDFTTAWLPNGVTPNQLLQQLGWSHGARALSRAHAAKATVLARASATVKAGQTLTLKPKRVSTAAVGAGTIYAAIRIRDAADPSNVGVVLQKIAVVKAAPLCKKGQKSTASKPCRKK
jgi:hypothetical protein